MAGSISKSPKKQPLEGKAFSEGKSSSEGKTSRDYAKTRARILGVGFEAIYRQGFHGASVNGIIEKAETTKGGFFHHFASKEALGYEIIDKILMALVHERWLRPLEDFENPVQGILRNWKRVIAETPDEHLALGCPLNNWVQEMAACDPTFHAKLLAVMEFWISGIESQLRKAESRGFLRKGAPLRRLAELTVTCHEGAFALGKLYRDRKVFTSLLNSLKDHFAKYEVATTL